MWIDQCEVIPPGKGWVEFSLPSTPQSLCLIADLAMATARHFGFQLQTAEELTQAVLEAAGNAVRHGNDLDPDKIVVVRFEKSGSRVTVLVDDQGLGFTPGEQAGGPAEVLSESGRGLFLMRVYTDEVSFEQAPGGGTRVVLIKQGAGETVVTQPRSGTK